MGVELWEKAQTVRRIRGVRRDNKRANIYRGLLVCPFCGGTLQHTTHWLHYKCHKHHLTQHDWWSLSARQYVTPEVLKVLQHLREPERAVYRLPILAQTKQRDVVKEQDRLTMAWVKGRLSDERYEAALADLKSQMQTVSTPPPDVAKVQSYLRELSIIDLDDRNPETGNVANELLRGLIERIDIRPDRSAGVVLLPGLEGWVHPD